MEDLSTANVLVATPLEPSQIGGVERLVMRVVERLKHDDNVVIVCGGRERQVYSTDGVKVYVLPARMGSYAYAPQAMNIFERLRPDIIYAHDYSSYMPYIATKYKRRHSRTRFVFHTHFHPQGSSYIAKLLRRFYDPLIGKMTLNHADAVICNTNAEKLFLKRFGVNKPMYVVSPGIDIEAIQRAKPYKLDEKVLLYVGRLERYKNIHLTIRALRYLTSDYHFYVVGTGAFVTHLKKLAQSLNLSDRVHFLGFMSNEKLYRWYHTSLSLVHLSEIESFGLTCIEALAAQTPVVANDDKYGLSETISLFPDCVLRFSKAKDNEKKLSELIKLAVRLKPVNVNLSAFSWDSTAVRVHEILRQHLFI